MPRDGDQTRKKIVDAATRLFYGEGIRAVSLDAVAEKASLTKKTIYYHFASKDDLVAAYLESQDQPTLALYQKWFDETDGNLSEKIRGVFDRFATAASRPKWRGCGFLLTIAELASTPGHPAVKAGAAHKKRFERWLTDVLTEGDVRDAPNVARQVVLLLDGAATVMLIHRDSAYVRTAGALAAKAVATASSIAPSTGHTTAAIPDSVVHDNAYR